MTFNELVQLMLGLGVILGGAGYGFGQFFSGRKRVKEEKTQEEKGVLDLLNERNKVLEGLIKAHEEDITQLRNELDTMKAVVQEKDSKIKDYMTILQNRSPELNEFMKDLTVVARNSQDYMLSTSKILIEIKDFMGKINQHFDAK